MRPLFLLLFSLSLAPQTWSQTEDSPPEEIISFQAISDGIVRVFPEAYTQFLTISFVRSSGYIYPDQCSFLIPDKYFKKELNQKLLEKRMEILLEQLELTGGCSSISAGEPEEYAWHEWKEKTVRKVTLVFAIGC